MNIAHGEKFAGFVFTRCARAAELPALRQFDAVPITCHGSPLHRPTGEYGGKYGSLNRRRARNFTSDAERHDPARAISREKHGAGSISGANTGEPYAGNFVALPRNSAAPSPVAL
jgi:hypothetical protein